MKLLVFFCLCGLEGDKDGLQPVRLADVRHCQHGQYLRICLLVLPLLQLLLLLLDHPLLHDHPRFDGLFLDLSLRHHLLHHSHTAILQEKFIDEIIKELFLL